MDSSSSANPAAESQIHQQETIAHLGQQALETDDLDQLMQDASVAVAETLDTEYANVLQRLPDGDEVLLRQGVGWRDGLVGSATVPTDRDSQAGYTLDSEAPVIVEDLSTEERFDGPALFTSHDVVSGISVIIGSSADPWGVLGTHTTEPRAFTEAEVAFVQSVANVLASAIETTRTQDEMEEIYGRISDAFFALDEEWRFTYFNAQAHEVINPEGNELEGEVIWEAFPAATERLFKPKYEQAMYAQETVSFEEYYPEPLDAWFEVRAYPSESGLSVYFRDVTDRKEREEELELFRTLLDHSSDSVMVIDPETGQFVDVNETACRRRGYSRAEFLDLTVPDLETEIPDLSAWHDFVAQLQSEGQLTFDGHHRRKDGSQYPIEVNASYIELDRPYVLSLGRDVSERRARERQLRQSEQRYRTLAEHFPNGIVTLYDAELQYTLAAGRAFDYLPVTPDGVEEHTPPEVWGAAVARSLEPVMEAALDGEAGAVEVDYEDREWIVHAVPVTDDEGEVFAGMTMAQDITEQKAREAEVERALDLLEKTERIADVGGWEVDTETKEPYWSDHLFDILDVDYDEQPSLDEALDVYHSEADREVVETAMEEALASGEPFEVEVRFPRPSGDIGWLHLQGEPEVEAGEVVTFRGAVQDVTERKERERRLETAIERLETSNERLEQFAYAASHDLQEPLRMVSSYLQLLDHRYGDTFDEDAEEFLQFAVDGADRMRLMIEGLLEYSRIETEGNSFEPVALDEVLDAVREDLQVRIAESNADLTVGDLPCVEGDATQLRQVFQNLLDNAIEYSGDDPPQVAIDAERDGADWIIRVQDEGVGFDPEYADKIFQVFERLHSRDAHSGTGIGLALCERIVERHGGEIWVDSAPGDGTTFSFTLTAVQT